MSQVTTQEADFSLLTSLRNDGLLLQCKENTLLSGRIGRATAFYMLQYHRDRILAAAKYFDWDAVVSRLEGETGLSRLHEDLTAEVDQWQASSGSEGPLKVRVMFAQSGHLTVEICPATPVPLINLFPAKLDGFGLSPFDVKDQSLQCSIEEASKTLINGARTHTWQALLDTQATVPSPFTSFKSTHRSHYSEARARMGLKSFQDPIEVFLLNPKGQVMEGSFTNVYFYRDGRWVTPTLASGGHAGTVRRWLLEHGLCEEGVVLADSVFDGEKCLISNGVRGIFPAKLTTAPL